MADSRAYRIIRRGADIAGASAGFALELLGGSAPGSGALVGAVLSSALKEFGACSLSVRQQTRMGAVMIFAANRISARLMNGDLLRSDGFFVPTSDDRAPSAILLEATLLK